MPPPLLSKDGLDSIDTSADEAANACYLFSANSRVSEFEVTEKPWSYFLKNIETTSSQIFAFPNRRLGSLHQNQKNVA